MTETEEMTFPASTLTFTKSEFVPQNPPRFKPIACKIASLCMPVMTIPVLETRTRELGVMSYQFSPPSLLSYKVSMRSGSAKGSPFIIKSRYRISELFRG